MEIGNFKELLRKRCFRVTDLDRLGCLSLRNRITPTWSPSPPKKGAIFLGLDWPPSLFFKKTLKRVVTYKNIEVA